jgi:hypothetical protein
MINEPTKLMNMRSNTVAKINHILLRFLVTVGQGLNQNVALLNDANVLRPVHMTVGTNGRVQKVFRYILIHVVSLRTKNEWDVLGILVGIDLLVHSTQENLVPDRDSIRPIQVDLQVGPLVEDAALESGNTSIISLSLPYTGGICATIKHLGGDFSPPIIGGSLIVTNTT